jgi:hypothetical protein
MSSDAYPFPEKRKLDPGSPEAAKKKAIIEHLRRKAALQQTITAGIQLWIRIQPTNSFTLFPFRTQTRPTSGRSGQSWGRFFLGESRGVSQPH